MCENCLCFNGKCFYGGAAGFCPCDYPVEEKPEPEDADTQTMRGNGVSWSDFFAK